MQDELKYGPVLPGTAFTLAGGVRIGLAILLYAGIIFGFVMSVLSYYFFTFTLPGLVITMLMTIGTTLLLGCLASVICPVIIRVKPERRPLSFAVPVAE